MTPAKFRKATEALGISQRRLALVLKCSPRLPLEWGNGKRKVPEAIGVWLDACVANRGAHPDPAPPKDWRGKRGPKPTNNG